MQADKREQQHYRRRKIEQKVQKKAETDHENEVKEKDQGEDLEMETQHLEMIENQYQKEEMQYDRKQQVEEQDKNTYMDIEQEDSKLDGSQTTHQTWFEEELNSPVPIAAVASTKKLRKRRIRQTGNPENNLSTCG
jgi:hypothetical protein